MRVPLAVSLLMLAACSQSAGEAAEAEYKILTQSRDLTPDEECAAKSKIAAGYLKDQDTENYNKWDLPARITCSNAYLAEQIRL